MGREKSNQGGDEGMLGDKYIHQKTKQIKPVSTQRITAYSN